MSPAQRLLGGSIVASLLGAAMLAGLGAATQEEYFPRGADARLLLDRLPAEGRAATLLGAAAKDSGVEIARISTASIDGETSPVLLTAPGSADPPPATPPVAGFPNASSAPWDDDTSVLGAWAVWGNEEELHRLSARLDEMGVEPDITLRDDVAANLVGADQGLRIAQAVLWCTVLAVGALVASAATRQTAVAQACGVSRSRTVARLVIMVGAWVVGAGLVGAALTALAPQTRGLASSPTLPLVTGVVARGALWTFAAGALGVIAGSQLGDPLLDRLRGRRPHLAIAAVSASAAVGAMALLPLVGGRVSGSVAENSRLAESLAVWERMPSTAAPSIYLSDAEASAGEYRDMRQAILEVDRATPAVLNVPMTPCDFTPDDGRPCMVVNREYVDRLRPDIRLDGPGPWLLGPAGVPLPPDLPDAARRWMGFQADLSCAEADREAGCRSVPMPTVGTYPTGGEGWPVLRLGSAMGGDQTSHLAEGTWILVVQEQAAWLSGDFLASAVSRSELLFLGEPAQVRRQLAATATRDRFSPAVDVQLDVLDRRETLARQRHRDLGLLAVLGLIEFGTLATVAQVVTTARRRRLFVAVVCGVGPWRRHRVVLLAAAALTALASLAPVAQGVLDTPWGPQLIMGQSVLVTALMGATALVVERRLTTAVLKEG